jgi:GNAT superfamily N-acetyltransferase
MSETFIDRIQPLEVEKLQEGCKEFYSTGHILGDLDIDIWTRHWEGAISQGYGRVWAVIDRASGAALGALGGYVGQDQSNTDLVFTEKFFFSRKMGRGTGLKLIKYAEEDLKGEGIKRIYMINLINHEPEKAVKLYSYLGYAPSEVLWVKEVS